MINLRHLRASFDDQAAFWQNTLSANLPVLQLYADYPRPPVSSFIRSNECVDLDAGLCERIQTICAGEKTTLDVFLLATLKTLLFRYTGQEDILVGSLSSDGVKHGEGQEPRQCTNVLVLRTPLADEVNFLTLLRQVAHTVRDAANHRDYPFEKLLAHMQRQGHERTSLFQVMFALCDTPGSLSGTTITEDHVSEVAGYSNQCELLFVVSPRGETFTVNCQYDVELFQPATITRLLDHYRILLAGIVAQPSQRLYELPLLSDGERQQLLIEWNNTQQEYPKDKCLHELFEEQVEKSPEAVAVAYENQQLSYRELSARANQLAHYLRKRGVGPDVLVGLCVERSLEMAVGLLGILKAGGAYIPLDPSYPKERLAFMLEDARVAVLVTHAQLLSRLPESPTPAICLDTDWSVITQESIVAPAVGVTAENLAYVIYTSGSAGKPKGVMVQHRGLINYLTWCLQAYPVAAGQGALVHSSLSFDLTVTGLYAPLLAGRTVYLLSQDSVVESLSGALRKSRDYSLVKITPAHLQSLGQHLGEEDTPGRPRAFIIGGEALLPEHIAVWKKHCPQTKLFNEYGPTETVVGCCVYEVQDEGSRSTSIPIGRPISNTQLYILDQHRNLVPIGVPGELHIGGDGLARGYLNQPEFTAEKFLTHSFDGGPAKRLYKTGDWVRYLPDGNIEFLGRLDHQVKLHGFRIELGEIESVLQQHPAIRDTVVVLREDTLGDNRLVVYLVPAQSQSITVSDLQSFLQSKLPDYMLPSTFVFLEGLPLTPNGKIDRRALPLPESTRPDLEQTFVAPRTPEEELIASIWAQVLGLERVSIHDSFFELGGHSLKAMQVVSRLYTALHVELSLRTLFETPTVAGLAALIPATAATPQEKPMNKQRAISREAKTVRDVVDQMAELHANEPFLISPDTKCEVTFKEFRQRARNLSYRLLNLGLAKGDKVAFLLDNGLFPAELILGTMYGGFVSVPLNLATGRSQLVRALNHSEARIVFVSDEQHALLSSIIDQVEHPLTVILAHPDHGPNWEESNVGGGGLPTLHEEDDALLVYTSGSTGQPKGVLASHRNFLAGQLIAIQARQLSPQDRTLCVLPLYHSNAIITLGSTLVSGGSVVLPRRFNVASFWNWVVEHRCTCFSLVPTIISHLVQWTDPYAEGRGAGLTQIRFARSSSAPLAPALHRAFEEKFRVLLIESMGMTEVEAEIFSSPLSATARKIGSPGIPCGLEVKIVDTEGHELPVRQTGEILVRGPSIMKGYYKDPAATAAVLSSDGWLRTGDLAYKDEDGYFFIAGRAKELIIKGGENITPREIDEALERHPAVLEAAAVGTPDSYLGEDIVAYVVLKPGAHCPEQELLAFCAQALGDFKTPTRAYFVEDLPKGPSGKLQRLKLLEREAKAEGARDETREKNSQDRQQGQRKQEFVTSRTSVEEGLAKIWMEVLQRAPIGVHDNFFDLGGHSLLAAGILSRVRETFHVGLPLRILFEAPTVAALAEHVASACYASENLQLPSVQALPQEGKIPLSFAQQRLWFLHQLDPESVEYNVDTALRFTGPLNIQAFEQTFIEIIRRHASLRTTFPVVDGQPLQSIAPVLPFSLARVDLSTVAKEQRESTVQQLAREEAQRPFDLACGPLFRATLLHLAENEHVLLLTMHHIISDRWSMEIFFWELGTLYTAFSAHQPSPLPDLSIQYADLAIWQRQRLQGEALDQQLAYWRQQLADAPRLLELPTDRPRPPTQAHRGAHQHTFFPNPLTRALHELSRREGATLFMTLLAAFQILLARYTGQDDIVVGSPTANRTRVETEELIGFFVNMLVLRTNLSGDPTFRELLQRVREVALGAYARQELPFEKLVEELRPERTLNHSPLFQVVFHLRNVPQKLVNLPHLQMEVLRYESGTAQFDLTLALRETPDGLEVEVEYNTDLFDAATITRMVGHYQTLLEGLVTNPDASIATLPLLTPAERQQLLVEWNTTQRGYPDKQCVHQLFEAQVERTPEAVAVVYEEQQLTYRELERRANQLAHYLQRLGIGPDVLVGLCVERSLEMAVGILGILKAGGAYVPLDPTYPQERLAFMLQDTDAPVLLTQRRLLERFPQHSARVICLDTDWPSIAQASQDNPGSPVAADTLAYVMYTSGSTGQPKGVAVLHRGILRLVCDVEYVQLGPEERFLQLAPPAFDASTFELWGALLHGSCCVLFPGVKPTPQELGRVLHTNQISILWLTASLFNLIIDEAPEILFGIRQLLVGGEALSVPHVQRALACLPQTQIINGYGPTESTTFTCAYPIPRSPDIVLPSIPIGRPITNTNVYIFDPSLQPVPVGVPGELYIGGAGLARGYLNRPELTAEKFIPHPFNTEPGVRLYRTGDRARYLPDGNIEFLGRLDHQVKLRGFRIELGEIESVLQQHPAIRDTVVVLREDTPGDKRLIAYLVSTHSQLLTVSELRSFLQSKLPDYMIPAAFVFLDTLLLTPNGKIDRKALPLPDPTRPKLELAFVAPRTPEEETIAEVWREVLGLEDVGIHDNFFELGGHSLKATQVMARLRTALQIELPLRTLFETPTVAGLAANIVHRQEQQPGQAELAQLVAEIESLSEEEARQVLSHIQQESIR